ncbi:MAG: phosphotransferase [Steroidobacteraceae bacterium]
MTEDIDAFMATMVARAVPVPIERALSLVRQHYGLDARAQPLTGERDQNVRLQTRQGAEYVLKIAHKEENPITSDFTTAALLHLEASDPSLPCPRVLRTRAGRTAMFFEDAGAQRQACVLTYLPGRPLGSVTRSTPQRVACGQLAARLTRSLRGFDHPGAHRAIIWDVRHIGRVRALLDDVVEFPGRHVATELLDALVPCIDAGIGALRQQVVHDDINRFNVLVDESDAARIVGVIDFGDATHTAIAADAAVVAAEQIPEDCADGVHAGEAILEVIRAYHEVMPLQAAEISLLGTLVAARLITSVVVQQWHRQHNPAGQHYAELGAEFIRQRLGVARAVLGQPFALRHGHVGCTEQDSGG